MSFRQIYGYYGRPDVQAALVEAAQQREVAGVFKDGAFGTRPNMLNYPQDVVQMVKGGAVAFHGSVERWQQPMRLSSSMPKSDLDSLRAGWELLLDIDIKDFEDAKIVTRVFIEALQKHGVKNVGCKFTGGKSFHICVPFESFPEVIDSKPASQQFPNIPNVVTRYLTDYVKPEVRKLLLAEDDIEAFAQKYGKTQGEVMTNGDMNYDKNKTKVTYISSILERGENMDIDKVITEYGLFTSRHLFRLPYSLNEKTLLVSLPINPDRVGVFQKDEAAPEKIKVSEKFIVVKERSDATSLVTEALDWWAMQKKDEPAPTRRVVVEDTRQIPLDYAPPCVKNILNGVQDGRKRSVFILANFLKKMRWPHAQIAEKITEWNAANPQPLPENYIRTQLRWHERQTQSILPPNCSNQAFYLQMGVCQKDELCASVKNPVAYAAKRFKSAAGAAKPKKSRRARKPDDEVGFDE